MRSLKHVILISFLLWPLSIRAQTAKTFIEDFKSDSKIEKSASFAFVNTKQKEATLPLQYDLQNYAKNLSGLTTGYLTAVGTDGTSVMAGSSNGSLILLQQSGMNESLTGLLAGKAKSIKAIDYARDSGWWLVGGEAKQKKDGAALFKLVPGGLRTEDLQAQTKDLGVETITAISCLGAQCLVAGTPKKLFLYDGNNFFDLSASADPGLNDPIKIKNNGLIWLVFGFRRDPALSPKPYIITLYTFDGARFEPLSLTEAAQSTSSGLVDAAWNGQDWLVVRVKPAFAVWKISGGFVQDVTSEFLPLVEKMTFDPILSSDGKTWFVGGSSLWKGLLAKNATVLTDLSNVIPDLKNINIFSAIKSPWKGALLAGSNLGKPFLLDLTLGDYSASSAVESKSVATAGSQIFKKAKIEVEASTPADTGIAYMLAAKTNSWESFEPGKEKEFLNKGSDLRWRAVFYTQNPKITPRLKKISITYTTETPDSPAKIKSRDATRISNLGQVMNALKKFKKDRGVYPVVDAADASARWNQLTLLLINGKFITKMPNDPLKIKDTDRQYDYLSKSDGSYYLLRATLEDPANKSLTKDLDGAPLQIFYANYSCDDPVYCQGEVPPQSPSLTTPSAPAPSATTTIPAGKVEVQLLRDPQGKIWRVVDNKKLYLPSPSIFDQLGYVWSKVKNVSQAIINKYARAQLVKIKNNPDIYYLTAGHQKRHIPTWQAFIDYGFKLTEVIEIKPEELAAFGNSYLIKLPNDTKVWKIEGLTKKLIPNPDIFKKYGFKWQDIAIVNWAEYNGYAEGAPLQ